MSQMISNRIPDIFAPTPAAFSRRVATTLRTLPERPATQHWKRMALAAAVPVLAVAGLALAWHGGSSPMDLIVPRVSATPAATVQAAVAPTPTTMETPAATAAAMTPVLTPTVAPAASAAATTPTPKAAATPTPTPTPAASAAATTTAPGVDTQASHQITATPYTARPLDPAMPADARTVATQESSVLITEPERLVNTALACKVIDGTVIQPGDTLSFNALVGRPTTDKGYEVSSWEAMRQQIEGTEQPIAGTGVSHVSTVLYMAAARADLEIVERHAGASAYAPAGQEALVSYDDGKDLVIRNSYSTPVQVSLSLLQGKKEWVLVCRMLAAVQPTAYEVQLQTGLVETILPPEDVLYKTDESIPPGEFNDDSAREGQRVRTDKVYLSGIGGVLLRKTLSEDTYPAKPRIITYNPNDAKPVPTDDSFTPQEPALSFSVGQVVRFSADYVLKPQPESAGAEGEETAAVPGADYTVKDIRGTYLQVVSADSSGWIPAWYAQHEAEIRTLKTPKVLLIAADGTYLRLTPDGLRDFLTLRAGQAVRVIREWQDMYCVQFVHYDAMNPGERWIYKDDTMAYSKAKCIEGFLKPGATVYNEDLTERVGEVFGNPVRVEREVKFKKGSTMESYFAVVGAGGFSGLIRQKDFVANPFQP